MPRVAAEGDLGLGLQVGGEVVIPVVAGDQTYPDRGLAQVAGRELGATLVVKLL